MPVFPIPRSELKAGDCLCNHCTALCCRYFSLPTEAPQTWDDYDNLRRFLTSGRVAVFVEDETWYLVVHGDCQYLTADYRCGIYTERPLICGQYTTDGCEYDNDVMFEKYFETPEQLAEYAEAILPPRATKKRDRLKRDKPSKPPRILPPETAAGRDHYCLKIETPTTWDDYDNCRWYMTHGPVSLLVADETWYLVVFKTASGLSGTDQAERSLNGSRQSATEHREQSTSGIIEKYFETPDQIWEYAAAILPDREPLERDLPHKLALALPVLNESR